MRARMKTTKYPQQIMNNSFSTEQCTQTNKIRARIMRARIMRTHILFVRVQRTLDVQHTYMNLREETIHFFVPTGTEKERGLLEWRKNLRGEIDPPDHNTNISEPVTSSA